MQRSTTQRKKRKGNVWLAKVFGSGEITKASPSHYSGASNFKSYHPVHLRVSLIPPAFSFVPVSTVIIVGLYERICIGPEPCFWVEHGAPLRKNRKKKGTRNVRERAGWKRNETKRREGRERGGRTCERRCLITRIPIRVCSRSLSYVRARVCVFTHHDLGE